MMRRHASPLLAAQLALLLLSDFTPQCHALSSNTPDANAKAKKTTISVCTGPDCRVDGASDCIRQLQKSVSSNEEMKSAIRVTGRACIGPCGDGPCVFINDSNANKVIADQPSKTQISLAPPDIFASNPKGWYQVRTEQQLEEALDIASQAARVEYEVDTEATTDVFVTSTRAWFDRPRNERKVLQRLMQSMVLLGIYSYDKNGELGNLQYQIAFALFLLSDFIMKENIWTLLFSKIKK